MCGRAYSTYSEEELYFQYLNQRSFPWQFNSQRLEVKPNYNMCPTHATLVLCVADSLLTFRRMRWGLVPGWAKTVKDADKYSMTNAKSEEIAEKRSYKAAFQRRRCIVPLSGFYEWKTEGKNKTPFAIYLKEQAIMSIAGIWEHWSDPSSEETVESFSIVTTSANSFMARIHTRMPVILKPEQESIWLDPQINDPSLLAPIMSGGESELLASREVSRAVNSPKNNSKELLNGIA